MTGPSDDEESDLEREAAGLPPKPRLGAAPTFTPPPPVRTSFWLWVASAVVLIAGFVLMVASEREIADALIEGNTDRRLTEDQIRGGLYAVLWMLAVGGAMFGVLFVLFAYKAREGTRSARSVLTALTVAVIAFQVLMWPFMNAVLVTSLVLACVALVLMHLPSVWGYFPPLPRTVRRWRDPR
ncbi:MAG: hypothetical protein ACRDQ7_08550 [Haloechinothrix sp.]